MSFLRRIFGDSSSDRPHPLDLSSSQLLPKVPEPKHPTTEWLRDLEALPLDESGKPLYLPASTVVIGLGNTGKVVLEQLKAALFERHQGEIPANARFLWLKSPSTSDSEILDDHECVPDPLEGQTQVIYDRFREQPYYSWLFTEQSGIPSKRQQARFHFFQGVRSREHSLLYNSLYRIAKDFGKLLKGDRRVNVVFVANLAEPESSILWDVAYLFRQRAVQNTALEHAALQVFAILATGIFSPVEKEAIDNIFAGLRETARFSFPGWFPFTYPDPELSGVADHNLIDYVFIVDSISNGNGRNLHATSLEEGVGRIISETLGIFIDPDGQDILENITNQGTVISKARSAFHHAFVNGFNIASWALPLHLLRQTIELRLLRTVFFGEKMAGEEPEGFMFVPLGQNKPQIIQRLESDEVQSIAVDFFRRPLSNNCPLFGQIAESLQQGRWTHPLEDKEWPDTLDRLFAARLAEWITEILNPPSQQGVFQMRSNRLPLVLARIEALEKQLPQTISLLRYAIPPGSLVGETVRARVEQWELKVDEAKQIITAWIVRLSGPMGVHGGTTFRTRRDISSLPQQQPSLLQLIETDWLANRDKLSLGVQGPVRRFPIQSGTNSPPYSGLESPFFEAYIRPRSTNALDIAVTKKPLNQIAGRVGWLCKLENQSDLELYLVIADPEYDGSSYEDGDPVIPSILYTSDQIPEIYRKLRLLAARYSRGIQHETILTPFERVAWDEQFLSQKADFLKFAQSTLLPTDIQGVSADTASIPKAYLLSPNMRANERFRYQFPHLRLETVQRGELSTGPQAISLLSLYYRTRLADTEIYLQSLQKHSTDSDFFVFRAEQRAAYAEDRIRVHFGKTIILHPLFVRLLEIDNLADLFLLGWIYELIGYDNEKKAWLVPQVGRYKAMEVTSEPGDLFTALEKFSLNIPCSEVHTQHGLSPVQRPFYEKAMQDALDSHIADHRAKRRRRWREIEKSIIPSMLNPVPAPQVQSMTDYILFLIEEERW